MMDIILYDISFRNGPLDYRVSMYFDNYKLDHIAHNWAQNRYRAHKMAIVSIPTFSHTRNSIIQVRTSTSQNGQICEIENILVELHHIIFIHTESEKPNIKLSTQTNSNERY